MSDKSWIHIFMIWHHLLIDTRVVVAADVRSDIQMANLRWIVMMMADADVMRQMMQIHQKRWGWGTKMKMLMLLFLVLLLKSFAGQHNSQQQLEISWCLQSMDSSYQCLISCSLMVIKLWLPWINDHLNISSQMSEGRKSVMCVVEHHLCMWG